MFNGPSFNLMTAQQKSFIMESQKQSLSGDISVKVTRTKAPLQTNKSRMTQPQQIKVDNDSMGSSQNDVDDDDSTGRPQKFVPGKSES